MLDLCSRRAAFAVFCLATLLALGCHPVGPPNSPAEPEDASQARDSSDATRQAGQAEEAEQTEPAEPAEPAAPGAEASEGPETLESSPGAERSGEGGKDGADRKEGTTSTVVLRFDQPVSFGNLSLRLLDLNDSRCPRGVQCIWEGQVIATLEVWRNDSALKTVEASGVSETAETVELTLRAGHEAGIQAVYGYELRLASVEPYPRADLKPARGAHVVIVEIRTL